MKYIIGEIDKIYDLPNIFERVWKKKYLLKKLLFLAWSIQKRTKIKPYIFSIKILNKKFLQSLKESHILFNDFSQISKKDSLFDEIFETNLKQESPDIHKISEEIYLRPPFFTI